MNIIRKIIVGTNPKDAMAYFLGMRAGDGKISAILLDDKYMHQFSRSRFLIYIENSEGTILWKSIESMPCVVEYDCKFN
jgi:malate/lactate dehydrogenase